MGWLLLLVLAAILFGLLWRFGRFDRAGLQLLASALLIAAAGYAWQGRPGLPGKPVPPAQRQNLPDSAFAEARGEMLGEVDWASRWLTIADMYHRSGDTQSAAGAIKAGLKARPRDPDLWVGLGNALVTHAGGMMTPAAELAFQRAARLAPEHPGPRFFYGLALAQDGKFDEAERIWRALLATAPTDAEWRPMVEQRLAMLAKLRALIASRALPQQRP